MKSEIEEATLLAPSNIRLQGGARGSQGVDDPSSRAVVLDSIDPSKNS